MADPRIGLVIATRNRALRLRETLTRLLALPEGPRVVVVDNGSTDETATVARGFGPRVEVVTLPENQGSAARNVGMECLDTPYIAFSDDDSWYEPGSLARAADLFDRHSKLALIAARILVEPGGTLDPTCVSMAASPLPRPPGLPGPAILGFLACGAVVRRSAFLDVGGFSVHFGIGGEETLLAIDLAAAGWELAYVDAVTAHHCPPVRMDHAPRRLALVRNSLWTLWLRRRLPGVLWRSAYLVGRSLFDRAGRAGIRAAFGGLPAILRDRHPVPPSLDRQLQLIE